MTGRWRYFLISYNGCSILSAGNNKASASASVSASASASGKGNWPEDTKKTPFYLNHPPSAQIFLTISFLNYSKRRSWMELEWYALNFAETVHLLRILFTHKS